MPADALDADSVAALRRLTDAIAAEARLTRSGAENTAGALASAIETRLLQRRLLERHPEIESVALEAPVVVIGMPRTGSTLLQNLLALHPDLRAPALWELLSPAAPARTDRDRRRLVDRARAYVREYYKVAPGFRAIHHLDAELPEECHRLLGTAFANDIYMIRYRIPSYARWLRTHDCRAAYSIHRSLLRCIAWRLPGPARMLLKCPTHLWHADGLSATYPDAAVVRLHRDPTEAIASASSLTAIVRRARSDAVDAQEIGRFWTEHAARVLLARWPAPLRVLDVRYRDLVAAPFDVVERICGFAGLEFGDRYRRRLARFFAHEPGGARGAHRYTPQEFGLDPGALARRFEAYRAEVGL